MSANGPPINIKLTVSLSEIKTIDAAVKKGYARSRADLCRKAIILYIHEQDRTEQVEA